MNSAKQTATDESAWKRFAVGERIRARFTVDSRALAALRITLGVTLVLDLLHRAQYIELFYTNEGVYPLDAFEVTYTQFNGYSLHALSGALWVQQALFVLAGLLAVALIVGYRTRLVGVLSLVLLVSLHGRNPAVLNGGDRLLRVLLLVALVTPLGERWSVDALRRGSARKTVTSTGTAALLVQPVAVFTSNALQKHDGSTWYAGDGLEIALNNDVMSIFLGDVLVEYPLLLTVLNYLWITLLAGSVVFLLLSRGWPRVLATFAYLGAFAGMAMTMAVGVFPLALAASVVPFLAPRFWDALARRMPAGVTEYTPAIPLGPLGRPPVEWRLLSALRERGHESVASTARAFAGTLLSALGVLVLAWILLFTATDVTGTEIPNTDSLDQQEWGLYAPNPTRSYSWYVTEAELANGSTVEAVDGGPVSFDQPDEATGEYDSFRHRKYMQAVRDSGGSDPPGRIATSYAEWACRQASDHGDPRRVTLFRLSQNIPMDGELDEPRLLVAVRQKCD
jgi:hypothetical protein